MKNLIKEKLVSYVSNAYADRYGQLGVINFYQVFKDDSESVLEYIKENPILNVNTYGYQYGTYKGIGSIHSDIIDEEIRTACQEAWKNNTWRINSLKGW